VRPYHQAVSSATQLGHGRATPKAGQPSDNHNNREQQQQQLPLCSVRVDPSGITAQGATRKHRAARRAEIKCKHPESVSVRECDVARRNGRVYRVSFSVGSQAWVLASLISLCVNFNHLAPLPYNGVNSQVTRDASPSNAAAAAATAADATPAEALPAPVLYTPPRPTIADAISGAAGSHNVLGACNEGLECHPSGVENHIRCRARNAFAVCYQAY
jgi:hypothetical protein